MVTLQRFEAKLPSRPPPLHPIMVHFSTSLPPFIPPSLSSSFHSSLYPNIYYSDSPESNGGRLLRGDRLVIDGAPQVTADQVPKRCLVFRLGLHTVRGPWFTEWKGRGQVGGGVS